MLPVACLRMSYLLMLRLWMQKTTHGWLDQTSICLAAFMAFDASGKVLPNEPDASGVHQRCHINTDYYSAEKVRSSAQLRATCQCYNLIIRSHIHTHNVSPYFGFTRPSRCAPPTEPASAALTSSRGPLPARNWAAIRNLQVPSFLMPSLPFHAHMHAGTTLISSTACATGFLGVSATGQACVQPNAASSSVVCCGDTTPLPKARSEKACEALAFFKDVSSGSEQVCAASDVVGCGDVVANTYHQLTVGAGWQRLQQHCAQLYGCQELL